MPCQSQTFPATDTATDADSRARAQARQCSIFLCFHSTWNVSISLWRFPRAFVVANASEGDQGSIIGVVSHLRHVAPWLVDTIAHSVAKARHRTTSLAPAGMRQKRCDDMVINYTTGCVVLYSNQVNCTQRRHTNACALLYSRYQAPSDAETVGDLNHFFLLLLYFTLRKDNLIFAQGCTQECGICMLHKCSVEWCF